MEFKYKDDLSYNLCALSYIFFSYLAGWVLSVSDNWINNVIGTLLLAHSMVMMAFFVHEFAHGSIFKSGKWNTNAGKLFMLLVFHGFFSFKRIQELHLKHHQNHADVFNFNFHEYLKNRPMLRNIAIALEWCYIPFIELLIKWYCLRRVLRGQKASEVQLIFFVMIFYIAVFAFLTWLQPRALLCLMMAYILLLHVLRFMDMHQHTYITHTLDQYGNIPKLPKRDKSYEQANTFTNLFSSQFSLLNLLVLNFGYHNAHHAKPFIPWCRLSDFHKELSYEAKEIPFFALLVSYHRFRIQRVFRPNMGKPDMNATPGLRAENFIRIVGGCFLNA